MPPNESAPTAPPDSGARADLADELDDLADRLPFGSPTVSRAVLDEDRRNLRNAAEALRHSGARSIRDPWCDDLVEPAPAEGANHRFLQGGVADDVCTCGLARWKHPGERSNPATHPPAPAVREDDEARVELLRQAEIAARNAAAYQEDTLSAAREDGKAHAYRHAANIVRGLEGAERCGFNTTVLESLAWNIEQGNVIAQLGTMGPTVLMLREAASYITYLEGALEAADELAKEPPAFPRHKAALDAYRSARAALPED